MADDLQSTTPLEVWTRKAGVTLRTAARLFRRETGMGFGQWRLQLRLLTALEQLAEGDAVSNVALNVGYTDVSSFIAVFKAALGQTPAKYFREQIIPPSPLPQRQKKSHAKTQREDGFEQELTEDAEDDLT